MKKLDHTLPNRDSNNKKKLLRRRIYAIIAAFVVVFTTYALTMPAQTAEAVSHCGLAEHKHSAECYEKVLVCGLEENETHQHTDDCYEEQLVCEKDEHVHGLACYSDPSADLETAEDWEETLPEDNTGIWADDLVAIANGQTGYEESIDNYQVAENGKTIKGYTRYGAWNDEPYADWSMDFVAFCLHYAAVDPDAFPVDTRSTDQWIKSLEDTRLVKVELGKTDYFPGDIIFFTPTKEQGMEVPHMGIVTKVDEKTITVVEGDRDNKVAETEYRKNSREIAVCFALPANPDPEIAEMVTDTIDTETTAEADAAADLALQSDADTDAQDELTDEEKAEINAALDVLSDDGDVTVSEGDDTATEGSDTTSEKDNRDRTMLTFEGSDYTVTASYTADANLPENVKLDVREIRENGATRAEKKEYAGYYEQTEAALSDAGDTLSSVRFYDIAFVVNEQEVEPQANVDINITYKDAETVKQGTQVKAIHLPDKNTADIIDATATGNKTSIEGVTFTADSFSVYGVVYTVDFHYEADGNTYEFSIPGGGCISIYDMVQMIGIASDDPDTDADEVRAFVENVKDVTSSAPSLVWIGKVEADTTVGDLKDEHDLDCTYSADLTDEAIDEINDREIDAVDWALISLQPFETEESLTIAMKNGDVFEVKVTDASEIPSDITFIDGRIDASRACIICYQDGNGYHVLKTDGSTETFVSTAGFDALDNKYRWNFYYIFREKDRHVSIDNVYYFIRPIDNKAYTVSLHDTDEDLVQKGANNIAILPQNGEGFIFEGYDGEGGNGVKLFFQNGVFKASDDEQSIIKIYQQDPLPEYSFSVVTDTSDMGKVGGKNEQGAVISGAESFVSITNTDTNPQNSKKNQYEIKAIATPNTANPSNPKYIFDHWELNGQTVSVGTVNNQNTPTVATIPAGALTIPYNSSELKAFFIINPNYVYNKNEKLGRVVDTTTVTKLSEELMSINMPLVEDGCTKTAEVYDYENRIYRVDLTSEGSLYTFSGDIDLGFILDVSASMLFPSKLVKANESQNANDHLNSDVVSIRQINDWSGYNRKYWQTWGFKSDRTYYLISDEPQTATVYKLTYDGSNWKAVDASKTGNGDVINSNSSFKAKEYGPNDPRNYDNNYTYQIYVDGDSGRTRAYYLEQSLNGAAKELSDIRNVLSLTSGGTADLDVKIAWNTFCNYITPQRSYTFSSVVPGGFTLEYDSTDFGGGTSTDIALLDAAGVKRSDVINYNDIYDSTKYGTSTNPVMIDGRRYGGEYKYHKWEYSSTNGISYSSKLANMGFQWTDEKHKYAVLITDGAPQRGGHSVNMQLIRDAAQQLKNQGVTLITIGLSMENVDGGSELLFDIADRSEEDNYPLFYSAKSGDELDDILNQIIHGLIDDAIVVGNITDTVADAFYPVDKATGKALVNNDIIDLSGNYLCNGERNLTDAQKETGYGKIVVLPDGTYQIEWENQNIYCKSEGWHGTVYEKAYEDLLGGNALLTNKGDAVIDAIGYKMSVTDKVLDFKTNPVPTNNPLATRHLTAESPRVNVNELSFNGNENTWTVYLGTEVNPKTELKKMFENVFVGEVVNDAKDTDEDYFHIPDMLDYKGNQSLHYPLAENDITDSRDNNVVGTQQTFKLEQLLIELIEDAIENEDTSRDDWSGFINGDEINWNKLIDESTGGKSIVIPYDRYGINDVTHTIIENGQESEHQDNSTITIKIEQTVVGEEEDLPASPHTTKELGAPVERYKLTVTYSPDYDILPKGQGGKSTENFHVGTYGTMYQGHAAGTETSENTHIINTFIKGLQITKKGQTTSEPLTGAEFILYRTARATDEQSKVTTIEGLDGTYYPVTTLDMSEESTATVSRIEALQESEAYYLVETKAPNGYNKLEDPIPVTISFTDNYVSKPGTEVVHVKPETGIYDWSQEAKIVLTHPEWVTKSGEDENLAYYDIRNDAGVELPSTGGPGTKWFYIIGALLLISVTGTILYRKRKYTNEIRRSRHGGGGL